MNATEPQNGNTRDVINAVSIYFTDRKDLFPAGAWFAFHRRRGEETRVCFRDGSPTSWAALMHLINTSPGRLTVDSNGLGWWPRRPDRCRLDTERLRQAIRDLLEEGEWLFDEEEIGWAQRYDFTKRVIDVMQCRPPARDPSIAEVRP